MENWALVEAEQGVYDATGDIPEFVRNQYLVALLPRVPVPGEFFRWSVDKTFGAERVDDVMLYSAMVCEAADDTVAALILADVYCGTDEELAAENRKLEYGWWEEDNADPVA
jgi:hypothetical protein